MNKLICLFFIVVIVSASLVPCCVDNKCIEIGVAHISHEQEDEEGNCSPFSSCPGCVLSVEISDAALLESPINLLLEHYPNTQLNKTTVILPGFWQPPRA